VLSTKYGRTQWGNREKWVNLTGRNTPHADAREIPLYAKYHTNTCNNNHTSDAGGVMLRPILNIRHEQGGVLTQLGK
jgi:hypothetical protein